jgi:hypothetical protein
MKRTELQPGMSRWKKTGGGSLHIRIGGKNKIIKPGEVFIAKEHEIPENFRDVIKPLDTVVQTIPVETPKAKVKVEVVEEVVEKAIALDYSIRARSGGGYYDVVDGDGKQQNEKALREGPAKELLQTLMG